ncbi:MAG: thioesterase family protein [Pseudomonadota bacterium]
MRAGAELKAGLKGSTEIVVGTRDTAPHVGSGKIKVLATPVMVNLMEAAALNAVEGLLPAGHQTVGTRLDISHIAATPVGMQVVAHAELVRIDGRRLTFRVSAQDERETIGEGVHERIVVNVERFDQRTREKAREKTQEKTQEKAREKTGPET